MRQHLALFANFICKFGNENLADYLREIVLPAFTDDTLTRVAYGSTFHLYEVEVVPDIGRGEGEPAIIGRFIRDTTLTRQQIFDEKKGLVQDERSMPTSPSAFFVLLLNDHRLIYFSETAQAPDISSFKGTIQKFLDKKYYLYINKIHKERVSSEPRLTKKMLREEIIRPNLEIVPLTNSDDLKSFVERYKTLQKVDITVYIKNDESSASDMIANVEAYTKFVKGKKTKISTSDNEGLDKEQVVEAISSIGDGANETYKFTGKDMENDVLTGDNDSFSVKIIVDHIPGETRQRGRNLYSKMKELIERNIIRRPQMSENTHKKVRDALREE